MPIATLRSLALGLPLMLALAFAAQAQSGRHGGSGRPGQAAVAAYVQANVLPVLRQQRWHLEAQLAPADQAALTSYCTQLAAVRIQLQAAHERWRVTPSRDASREKQLEQLHALQHQEWELFEKVQELAAQYQQVIEQQLRQLAPQHERWANDLLALQAAPAAPIPAGYRRDWRHVAPLVGMMRPLSFLLLEPAAPAELRGTTLSPNPATAAAQLHYEVRQAGPVRAQLLDAQGQPLRELFAESVRQPGTYTQPLDLGSLAPGTYFYRLTTPAGTETRQFVKE